MRSCALFIFLLIFNQGFGQNRDAHAWMGVGLDMPINKKFGLEFESQLRLDQNFTRYSQAYGELSGNYAITKDLKVGLVYRYSRKNEGDYFYNDNRFCADANYELDFDPGLELKFRARYQFSFDRMRTINHVEPDLKSFFRLSAKLRYKNDDFKRVQPFIGVEIYTALKPKNSTAFLGTYRIKCGVTLDLPNRIGAKIYYMFEHENRNTDNNNHIYCVQLDYSFKSLHKRKKDDKKL